MDQIKKFMAVLKKHHFWVLTGLVLILTMAGWYLASSDLAEQYVANKAKIDGEFSELSGIVSKTDHPNATFKEGTNVLTADLKKDVQTAWSLVFADQKAKVLKWPTDLGEDFVEWMDAAEPNEEIPVEYRERYLNYVKEEFPRLLTMVDAKPFWNRDEDGAGPVGPGGRRVPRPVVGGNANRREEVPQKDFKVIWENKNQKAIDESLDFPRGTPSTQAMRFCQENLWVYHAMLNAIASVNKGATGHHNAKIKEIISLNIGQDASALLMESLAKGRLVGGEANSGAAMGMMPMGMEGGAMPEPPAGDAGGGEGMQTPGIAGRPGVKPLDDKRYVDEKGVPMPNGTTGPAEFKRMPIVIRLLIDQREIAKLLVALADSPLPVEIRQLRVNTKMHGWSNQKPIMFGGNQDAGGAMGGRGSNLMKRDKSLEEAFQNPYDLAIELQGVIYIFNPPDKSLTVAEVAEGEAMSEETTTPTEEATPAEETPPAAASEEEPAAEPTDSGEPAEKPAASKDAAESKSEGAETEEPADKPAAEPAEESAEPAADAPAAEESDKEAAPEAEEAPEAGEAPADKKKPAAKAADEDAPFGEE